MPGHPYNPQQFVRLTKYNPTFHSPFFLPSTDQIFAFSKYLLHSFSVLFPLRWPITFLFWLFFPPLAKSFPSPDIILLFPLRFSSPPLTKYFPSPNIFPHSISVLFLLRWPNVFLFWLFFLRWPNTFIFLLFFPPLTKYFHILILFSSVDQIFSFFKYNPPYPSPFFFPFPDQIFSFSKYFPRTFFFVSNDLIFSFTNIFLFLLLRSSSYPQTIYFPSPTCLSSPSVLDHLYSLLMNGQRTHQTLYKFWKHFILATFSHHPDLSDDHHIVILLNWPHLNLGIFTRTKCISSGLPEPITTTYIFGNLKVWATNLLIRVLSYFKRQYCSRFW